MNFELGIEKIKDTVRREEFATLLQIETQVKAKLIEAGYTYCQDKGLDVGERVCFAVVKANGRLVEDLAQQLFEELKVQLEHGLAGHFDLGVYPDDQYKLPAFGYFAECRFI